MSNTFGNRLKALRKKAGFNQEDLADAVGVSVMTIRRWEWNERTPRVDEVKALAKALGVSEAQLLNDDPPVNSGGWVLNIRTVVEFKEEVIDLTAPIANISNFSMGPKGCSLTLTADWETWLDPANLKSLLKQLHNAKPIIEESGKKYGYGKD